MSPRQSIISTLRSGSLSAAEIQRRTELKWRHVHRFLCHMKRRREVTRDGGRWALRFLPPHVRELDNSPFTLLQLLQMRHDLFRSARGPAGEVRLYAQMYVINTDAIFERSMVISDRARRPGHRPDPIFTGGRMDFKAYKVRCGLCGGIGWTFRWILERQPPPPPHCSHCKAKTDCVIRVFPNTDLKVHAVPSHPWNNSTGMLMLPSREVRERGRALEIARELLRKEVKEVAPWLGLEPEELEGLERGLLLTDDWERLMGVFQPFTDAMSASWNEKAWQGRLVGQDRPVPPTGADHPWFSKGQVVRMETPVGRWEVIDDRAQSR